MYIDILTKIKNAERAEHASSKVQYSKMNYAIVELLKRYKFLKKAEVKGRGVKKFIEIEFQAEPHIHGLKFLSTPSRRLYGGYRDFKKVKGGMGVLAVSTSSGIMAGHEARKQKLGGQLLFEIW